MGIHASSLPTIAISRGRKKPGGGVEGKDRFWLTNARAVGSGRNAYRELAPEFAAYNDEPTQPRGDEAPDAFRARVADHHAARRILHGTIMHSRFEAHERGDLDGAVNSRFQAQTVPSGMSIKPPPGQAPWCTGNGHTARRWDGAKWASVPCPGDKCEFRREGTGPRGQGKHSQKTSTLVLQLRWPMAPCPGCKGRCVTGPDRAPCAVCKGSGRWSWGFTPARAMLETGGTYSYATDWLWGFYDLIAGQWKAIGGQGEPDLYGLPVRLSLVYKSGTGAAGPWAAWIVQMEPDFDECGGTLQGWLANKAASIAAAGNLLEGLPAIKALPIPGAREAVDAVYEEISRPNGGGR
jgi:hypothetical protein